LKIRPLGAPAAAADSSAPTNVHAAMEVAADGIIMAVTLVRVRVHPEGLEFLECSPLEFC
jgi:hypothetical protein